MKRVMDSEIELLTGIDNGKKYVNDHMKKFPEFYKDSVMSGVKRANNIWTRRLDYTNQLKKKKSTIVVPHKVIVAPVASNGKVAPSLPDHAEILVKILNELRIHTMQYDELLQIAKAPKQPFGIPHK